MLRAMDLDSQFLEKIYVGKDNLQYLTQEFVLEDNSYDAEVERAFFDSLAKVKADRKVEYVDNKLEFVRSIRYGENVTATKSICVLHSTQDSLQDQFDYLLERGIEYKMCRMLSIFPKVINQGKETLNQKLNSGTCGGA
jgi:hypothetical protein